MKNSLLIIFAIFFLMIATGNSFAQITSAASGNWNNAATWTGGVIPSAASDVNIAAGNIVTVDVGNAACKNLTIDGTLGFGDADALGITINGSVTINATGKFYSIPSGNPTGPRTHLITIKGDLTVITGGNIDMRKGSNPNAAAGTVIFDGTTTSNITLTQTAYASSIEEFNSITINKTGGAKVILKSGNLYQSNNTSTLPSVLTLTSGIIETQGTSIWGCLRTSNDGVVGASSSSYVKGTLGKGLSNTSGNLSKRDFPVGDDKGYRPVTVRASAGLVSGHLLVAQLISGNANNSSTFAGGIDRVSAVRYYKVSYTKSGTAAAASVTVDTLGASYAAGDGVAAGNTNLRVAYSINERALWTGVPQTVAHITAITSTPTTIFGDLLSTPITLADGGASCYIALARLTGTTENSLTGSTDVEKVEGLPASFELSQNYPNPFNPSTSISFSIPLSAFVTLKVYDAIGKEVANLVNEYKDAGNYKVGFDASKYSSGVYFYRLQAGSFISTKKMILMK